MNIFRIIVAGSRDFNDYNLLERTLLEYINTLPEDSFFEIVSGHARGADALGEKFADKNDFSKAVFPAKWDEYGKRAGYIRNSEMAKYASEKNGVLFAFWDGKSKGTKHMIGLGNKSGLDVHVVKYGDD